mgnify:CR=1 FL=1
MSNEQYLSEEGFKKLREELEDLKINVRRQIADRLEYAKSLGDLSENSEYQEAKEAQLQNETKIVEIEDILSKAIIIPKTMKDNSVVAVGSYVKIKKEGSDKEEDYYIVGSEEADPINKKISNNSPIGRSLIGKKVGDNIVVTTPQKEIKYVIIEIK